MEEADHMLDREGRERTVMCVFFLKQLSLLARETGVPMSPFTWTVLAQACVHSIIINSFAFKSAHVWIIDYLPIVEHAKVL